MENSLSPLWLLKSKPFELTQSRPELRKTSNDSKYRLCKETEETVLQIAYKQHHNSHQNDPLEHM